MRQNTHPAFLTFLYRLPFLSAWLSRTPGKIHSIPRDATFFREALNARHSLKQRLPNE
jgi:hypothetical protein